MPDNTKRSSKVGLSILFLLEVFCITPAHSQDLHATAPLPSYEVATIKPWDGTGFGITLRNYIAVAYNIPSSSVDRLIGPDWINKKSYVIRGKIPDALQEEIKKMPPAKSANQNRLMMQSLLAERFKFQAHFEIRELPIFELVLAKGGSKMTEVPAKGGNGAAMISGSQLKGSAVPMTVIIDMLIQDAEIGGRPIIDKTGLTGYYDVKIKWTPARTVESTSPMQPAPAPDTEGPSLFTALQENLGLKLIPSKGPVQVLVIDHIEPPTEN